MPSKNPTKPAHPLGIIRIVAVYMEKALSEDFDQITQM